MPAYPLNKAKVAVFWAREIRPVLIEAHFLNYAAEAYLKNFNDTFFMAFYEHVVLGAQP